MQTALLLLPMPKEMYAQQTWSQAIAGARAKIAGSQGVTPLGSEMFEFQLSSGFATLSELVSMWVSSGLEYRVLFLEEKPEWIHSQGKP